MNLVQTKCTFCGGVKLSAEKCFKMIIKEKEKFRADGDSENKRTELTPHKGFIYRSEDHLIAKCPNPLKYNEKSQKQVRFSERGNFSSCK